MYKKLPKTLFKHHHGKFLSAPGYSHNGILIFTSEQKAKAYDFTDAPLFDEEVFMPTTKAYSKISSETLIELLEERENEVNPAGQPYTLIFNLTLSKDNSQKYQAIYTFKEFLTLFRDPLSFCNGSSNEYDQEKFSGLMNQFDFQGELTGILDNHSATDFNQQIINEIVLWKVNRYVSTNTEQDWISKLNEFKNDKEVKEEKLREFLKMVLPNSVRGIRLAMASTFLRFRNPGVYQIIDERTYRIIMREEETRTKLGDFTNIDEQIDLYIRYLVKLNDYCVKKNINFRDSDRVLYQFDIVKNGDFN